MSFVLRAAFWLTVLAFLLPAPDGAGTVQTANRNGGIVPASYDAAARENDIDAGEALALAARSAQDVMGFCGRNPEVCEKSHAIAGHVVRQATHYGSLALVWLTEKAKDYQQENPAEAVGARSVARSPAASGFTTGA